MPNYKCINCDKVTTFTMYDPEPLSCQFCGEAGSEPLHVEGRTGKWWKAPGRPAIHGTPMTAAQRKARSRALTLGALTVDLEEAARLAFDWHECMKRGRPGATDKDIESAFQEIFVWISRARANIPKS